MVLEKPAIVGNSPVFEIVNEVVSILSSAEHEEFRVNLGGPPSKAKYESVTDSE